MKRKTMAIFAVAAFVILSAVLIQAVDTDAREGDSENDPKYIIGGFIWQGQDDSRVKVLVYEELGAGLEARISYNSTAFANATATFSVKGDGDYQEVTLSSQAQNPPTGSVDVNGRGITVTITRDSVDSGVYTVQFKPGTTPVKGTIFIKMTVKEEYNSVELSQDFYYAANISTQSSKAKIKVFENDSDTPIYDQSEQGDTPSQDFKVTFKHDTAYHISLQALENTAPTGQSETWTVAGGYSFYGSDLPDGIFVTVDGRIGGKLSSDVQDATGKMKIHAVKNGVVQDLEMNWEVGTKPTAGFVMKDSNNNPVTKVMQKVGDSTEITLEASNNGIIDSVEASVKGATAIVDGASKKITIDRYEGTGTYVVTITAKMTYGGVGMTVQETLTIYVVGGIYDGNLKPVVKTA